MLWLRICKIKTNPKPSQYLFLNFPVRAVLRAALAMYDRYASLRGVTSAPCTSSILSHLRTLKALKLLVLFAWVPSHCSPEGCGLSFQVQGVFNNENEYLLPPFPLSLCLTDIKRLAEKEDWVVDNEGLTSLVGILVCVVGTFLAVFLFASVMKLVSIFSKNWIILDLVCTYAY